MINTQAVPIPFLTRPDENRVWYCKEYWFGDSYDGQYSNGEGYHYFEMQGAGTILKAYEYYETDDGQECVTPLPDFIGLNWFTYFGYEDDELLEPIAEYQFTRMENLVKRV